MKDKSYHKRMFEAFQNPPVKIAHFIYLEEKFLHREIDVGSHVLDVGCGDGRTAHIAAIKVGEHGQVYGIDLDAESVRLAQEKSTAFRNLEFRRVDARKTPYAENQFTFGVLSMNIIGTVDEATRDTILQELKRVVRPGGSLLGTVYSENAGELQKDWYESIGGVSATIDKNFVRVLDVNFSSERFSQSGLEELFSRNGIPVKIGPISECAYGFKGKVW